MRSGIPVGQRHRAAARQMRHRRRRHRDRHVHLERRADGAVQSRTHRQGHGVRGLLVRLHDGMDELSRLLHRRRRQAAGPHRHASRDHRTLRSVPMRRRAGGLLRYSERTRMDRALRAGAGRRGAGTRRAFLHQPAAHAKPRCAGSLDRATFREIHRRRGAAAARRRSHRQRPYEYRRSVSPASAASCPRSRSQGGIAERTADELSARDHHSRRHPCDGRYPRGRRAYRGDPDRTRPNGNHRVMTVPRLTRSYLAVPAHRARLVQNAAASAADAVFMDLEDAVPPAEKAAALEAAAAALTAHDWGRKTVAVRLNAIDSPSIQNEIERLGGIKRLDAFIIPKAEAVADITRIARWITDAAGTRDAPAEMELLIETARGLINVEALAASDP